MTEAGSKGKPLWVKLSVVAVATVIVICLVCLGNWQMQRLSWKLDLIEQVKSRAYSAPVPPPAGKITEQDHAYTRIKVTGRYKHDKTVLVKAVTVLGQGYWVLTPLISPDSIYWINRGFVPQKLKSSEHWVQPAGDQSVIGLLRITEPEGTLLEKNNPAAARWYSRDIGAISDHVGMKSERAYFLDLEAVNSTDTWPRAGLTILKFRNNHLAYALTWYAMALLLGGALLWFAKEL